jgi:hypothetical protein
MKLSNFRFIKAPAIVSVLCVVTSSLVQAGTEGMKEMPMIQPKKSYSVPTKEAGEELDAQRGYGDQEPMVRMMNLMMVEGSGMEGMDMGGMKMSPPGPANPAGGSMPGMNMAAAATSDVKAPALNTASNDKVENAAASKSQDISFDAKLMSPPAKVGANMIEIKVTDAKSKKPVSNAKFKAEVYMTSMNMGVDAPKVKETAPGTYQVKAVFAMAGPWALKLVGPNGLDKVINFEAGSQK